MQSYENSSEINWSKWLLKKKKMIKISIHYKRLDKIIWEFYLEKCISIIRDSHLSNMYKILNLKVGQRKIKSTLLWISAIIKNSIYKAVFHLFLKIAIY